LLFFFRGREKNVGGGVSSADGFVFFERLGIIFDV
jgi:hypothetical protein